MALSTNRLYGAFDKHVAAKTIQLDDTVENVMCRVYLKRNHYNEQLFHLVLAGEKHSTRKIS